MSITIYGASDDLIEVTGDIHKEFNVWLENDETILLAFSDGTLLRANYDKDGIWRFTLLFSGIAQFSKTDGSVNEDTSDVVALTGIKIKWVALATAYAF